MGAGGRTRHTCVDTKNSDKRPAPYLVSVTLALEPYYIPLALTWHPNVSSSASKCIVAENLTSNAQPPTEVQQQTSWIQLLPVHQFEQVLLTSLFLPLRSTHFYSAFRTQALPIHCWCTAAICGSRVVSWSEQYGG